MAVYATVLINIHDPQTYELYTAGWLDVWTNHNGEVVAVDDDPIVIEGDWPSRRTVIMKFPSEADFNAWYWSSGYQDLVKHRHAASSASFALVREFVMPARPSSSEQRGSRGFDSSEDHKMYTVLESSKSQAGKVHRSP